MTQLRPLRLIIFISVLAVILFPAFHIFYISPSFSDLIIHNTEKEAVRVAMHLEEMLIQGKGVLESSDLDGSFSAQIDKAMAEFEIMKIKVFSPRGEILFSSDPAEIGQLNTKEYFQQQVAHGQLYTKLVTKDSLSLEGKPVSTDVVETYVPVMHDGDFWGAFEIYYEITGIKRRLDVMVRNSQVILYAIGFVLIIALLYTFFKAKRSIEEKAQADEKIIRQGSELLEKHGELTVLFEVSRVISRTIDMDELLPEILKTVVNSLAILRVEKKGGIFIVEGRNMRLACHLGHPSVFLEMHNEMTVDTCLCGLAARTGELIISANSSTDPDHTICYHGMIPHGHIIVPLKSAKRVIGVLYLYIPADIEVDDYKKGLLLGIGNQIGIAIDNSRLYSEAKKQSYYDPLTGLANRRLMDISLTKAIALARRYGKKLSVIMLDIDLFKRYNDTNGHAAGDELLVTVATVLREQVRDSDTAVRYGGEEFLLILPEATIENAVKVAERIRKQVSESTPVTISCGVAAYSEDTGWAELVNAADKALYVAKEKGRNRVELNGKQGEI